MPAPAQVRVGSIEASGARWRNCAELSEVAHLPVADFTAVPGEFDFNWNGLGHMQRPRRTQLPDAASALRSSQPCRRQLASNWIAQVPRLLVIDHAEKPRRIEDGLALPGIPIAPRL